MYVITINLTPTGDFPRQFARIELPTPHENVARTMFSIFRNKFPSPEYACRLDHVQRDSIELIGW